jgi:hypothetical protein
LIGRRQFFGLTLIIDRWSTWKKSELRALSCKPFCKLQLSNIKSLLPASRSLLTTHFLGYLGSI